MAYRMWYSPVGWLSAIVNFFLILVTGILFLRVILRLFSANSSASFVNWIYSTSSDLMAPFRGIFPTPTFGDGYVLDLPAIFAIIVYALVGFLILSLLGMMPGPWSRNEVVEERPVRTRTTRRR